MILQSKQPLYHSYQILISFNTFRLKMLTSIKYRRIEMLLPVKPSLIYLNTRQTIRRCGQVILIYYTLN